ncbi:MAG: hypothetical protein CW742_14340 [Methanoregula sp.]|nr:MAG: hypothetical protein CW742_14340 [Methanoregula sp.]
MSRPDGNAIRGGNHVPWPDRPAVITGPCTVEYCRQILTVFPAVGNTGACARDAEDFFGK